MYKIGKKYIDSNFEHLFTSNFTESLFFKCLNPYKILQDLSDVKFRRADMVGISKSAVHRTLTENLDMRKLCA